MDILPWVTVQFVTLKECRPLALNGNEIVSPNHGYSIEAS